MSKTGGCICGAVRFEISGDVTETGACHCSMCRRWSGGVYLGIQVPLDQMKIEDESALTIYASSPWAERAFCATCGSNMYYRVTAPGAHQGTYHVGLGSFDEPDGIVLKEEIFIDKKPDGYAFAGETGKMTEAEMMALFAPQD
ncbi:MAG: GFA family protein [Pseudomonadota bacterium]